MQDEPQNTAQVLRLMCRGAPKNIIALEPHNPGTLKRILQGQGGTAQIFNFNAEITRKARELSIDHLPLMGSLMERIRLPFQSILMTYPVKTAFDGVDDNYVCCDLVYQSSETVLRVIPLSLPDLAGGRQMMPAPYSYTITLEKREKHFAGEFAVKCGAMVAALSQLELGQTEEQISATAKRIGTLSYGITGAVAHYLAAALDKWNIVDHIAVAKSVINHFDMHPAPWGPPSYTDAQQRQIGPLLAETNGHLRMCAALLLLLNLRDQGITSVVKDRQKGNFSYRHHRYPYMAEHSVTIKLPEPKVLRALQNEVTFETGIHHRNHPVIGHWCVRGGLDDCRHEWISDSVNRSYCDKCKRCIYYRKDHRRGDASLGMVQRKSYEVEKR